MKGFSGGELGQVATVGGGILTVRLFFINVRLISGHKDSFIWTSSKCFLFLVKAMYNDLVVGTGISIIRIRSQAPARH